MTKTHRAAIVALLEALKRHGCITDYAIDGERVTPDWREDGFDKAFHELKTNPKPFGLKKKTERAWLMILLAEKNKKAVDEWTFAAFKENYGS